MIKFSTKTNYKIVSIAQKVTVFIFSVLRKPVSSIKVKRNDIYWDLNLSEVIDFMIYIFGGFDKKGGKSFGEKLKSNDIIIDVGANVGSFALVVSKYIEDDGRILALEPSAYAYDKFKNNLELNESLAKRIIPIQAFVTRNQYQIPKSIHASWNMNSKKQRHPNHKGILTPTKGAIGLSLDQLVDQYSIKKLDWLKVDVDGFEKDVLLGGQHVFEYHKPNVFMELCEYSLLEHSSSVDEILSFLIQFNYHFYSVKGKDFKQDIQAIKRTIPKMGTTNVFAYYKAN